MAYAIRIANEKMNAKRVLGKMGIYLTKNNDPFIHTLDRVGVVGGLVRDLFCLRTMDDGFVGENNACRSSTVD